MKPFKLNADRVTFLLGLPGTGKTTFLASRAQRAVKAGVKVYSNFAINMEGVTMIRNEDLGVYDFSNCLLLLDEGEVLADSRSYKGFSRDVTDFLMLHRHYNCEIVICAQRYMGVDVKYRALYTHFYKLRKLGEVTLALPFRKQEKDLELGYEGWQPAGIVGVLTEMKACFRPIYYGFIDSFERKKLKPFEPNDLLESRSGEFRSGVEGER